MPEGFYLKSSDKPKGAPPCFKMFGSHSEACKVCPFGIACRNKWLKQTWTAEDSGLRLRKEVRGH